MKIGALPKIAFFIFLLSPVCFSQDPLPVIKSNWQPATQKGQKIEVPTTGPAKLMTVDDTYVERVNRAARADHPDNPSTLTPDGRRATIEKNEEEANTAQPADVKGFAYFATVRNDGSKTVKVIFWEYQFRETAHPENLTRRQFLCSVNLKKGAELELRAFSTLGPTGSIDSGSLAVSKEKGFDEKVQINRIEYADDDVLQRGNWKLADVKAGVDRATATPWGKEICRPL